MKKIQVPAIGGIRKVIQPGSNVTAGTTIAEIGTNTITLAQLAAILTNIQNQQVNTGGGNVGDGTEAVLIPGPGLSGGGPMLGSVPIRLTAPIPWGLDDGGGGGDGDPGPPGAAGAPGVPGAQGAMGPAVFLDAEAGEDGLWAAIPGTPGGTGNAGAPGAPGAQGPTGPAVFLDAEAGEDGLWAIPGGPGSTGPPGAPGAIGPMGPAVFMDAEAGEDGLWAIPGAPGAAGAAGAPGAAGAAGVGIPGFDGDPGEDGMRIPGVNASALVQQRGGTWTNGLLAVSAPAADIPIVIAEDCTITDITILTEGGTGSCAIDIWRVNIAGYPPTVANSIISGTSYPTITSGVDLRDTTLAGFAAVTLSKGDCVTFHLRSTSVFTSIVVMLSLRRVGDSGSNGYTDARAEDAVGGILSNSGNVHFTYVSHTSISASVVSSASLASPGFSTDPSGAIHQWGTVNIPASGGATVTFPLAFPNGAFVVNLTPAVATNGTPYITALSASSFSCDNSAGSSPLNHYWHAIGW
jgi:hypothetical protein